MKKTNPKRTPGRLLVGRETLRELVELELAHVRGAESGGGCIAAELQGIRAPVEIVRL